MTVKHHLIGTLCLASLLGAAVLALWDLAYSVDPRQRGIDGIPLRQGHHIEWLRGSYRRADGHTLVVWSDTRTGDRDVYGQLIAPDGRYLWDSTGIPIIRQRLYRQEDPECVAVTGGWIVVWNDFRNDTAGDVWAQRVNDAGQLLWDPLGVLVDEYTAMVNEVTIRVVPDGQDGAIVAWEVTRRGDVGDIYAQRVTAQGQAAWPLPLAVVDTLGTQTGITADGDGQGNLLVAWNDTRDLNNQNVYVSKVTPSGTLPWGRNGRVVFGQERLQEGVKLCPDGVGGCYLACVTEAEGAPTHDLLIQRIDANGNPMWQENGIPLCNASEDQWEVRVALSNNGGTPDGCLTIWWDQRVNGLSKEVYVQKVLPTGSMAWMSNGLFVCGDATPDGSGHDRYGGRLTTDNAGGLIGSWEDTRTDGNQQNSDLYAARVLANGTFAWGGSCGIPVAVAANMQFAPLLRLDSGDGVFIIWSDTRLGSQYLRYQNVDLASGYPTLGSDGVGIVYGLDGNAKEPQSVAMSPGQSGFVWADNRMLRRGRMIYYQIIDTLGHMVKDTNGVAVAPDNSGYDVYSQDKQQISPDGSGGFFVAFEDVRSENRRIRLQRISAQGGRMCTDAARVVYDDPSIPDQQWSFCAPDDAGGCYVAWSNYDPDYHIDVFIQRMNSNCEPVWAQPIQLSTAEEDDIMFGVASNPDGCCIALWLSGGLGNYNVTAARVCPDGSITWNRDVCDAINNQFNPSLVADGQGGAFFAWADSRAPIHDRDIYAQHMTADGSEAWGHNGILIISDTLQQDKPKMAVDSQHNLYVVWEDFRTGEHTDIRSQKVAPGGTLLWPTEGKPICTALGTQVQPALAVDWWDGLYALWSDTRVLHADVYATHFRADGQRADPYYQPDSGGVICDYYQGQELPTVADDFHGGVMAAWQDLRASGKEFLYNIWAQWVNDYTVSVRDLPSISIPTEPELGQNYPNPFNPSTRFSFSIPRTGRVEIHVFNTLGQQVGQLLDKTMAAGSYELAFDAARLPSGTYFYRLKTGEFQAVRKMMLLR